MRIQQRAGLIADGFSDAEVQRRVRAGDLIPVRRGSYLSRGEMPSSAVARHALRVRATYPRLAPDSVVSHASAAALFDLPLWAVPLDRVHITRMRRHGGHLSANLHVHSAALAAGETVVLGALEVTSVARTVADLARSLPFESAVVLTDAALGRRLVTPDEVAAVVSRGELRPGSRAAHRVLDFADGRSESPGESRSRVRIRDAGLPPPELQLPIETDLGPCYADFAWPAHRLVGEFDGMIKYGALLRAGDDPSRAVVREKLREDAIRDADWRVIRWVWNELDRFGSVAARIRRRLS